MRLAELTAQPFRTMLAVLLILAFCQPARAKQPKVDFAKQIKPLLSNRCFACHGPDQKSREGELRLDLRDEAIKEAITPGNAAKSELLARLTTSDPADLEIGMEMELIVEKFLDGEDGEELMTFAYQPVASA